jgi:hypothetical protein
MEARESERAHVCEQVSFSPTGVDHIGTSLGGKGSPGPGLESSGWWAGMPGRN